MFLIIGGDSEIGAAASRAIKARGLAVAATTRRREHVAPTQPFLDLGAPLDAFELAPQIESACLCVAIARIAACAADPTATAYINVDQTLALIDKLLARGVYVLFLSTNQVFDGKTANVAAEATYSPVSEYGRQKARAEIQLRERMGRGAPLAILRLAKVVSPNMPLIEGWIAGLSAGRRIEAFGDMVLAPTPIDLVCAVIGRLLQDRPNGIFQLSGPRDVTYAELGQFIARQLGLESSLVKKTDAQKVGFPAGSTPENTTLDSSLLLERYGFEAPDVWKVFRTITARATAQNSIRATCF